MLQKQPPTPLLYSNYTQTSNNMALHRTLQPMKNGPRFLASLFPPRRHEEEVQEPAMKMPVHGPAMHSVGSEDGTNAANNIGTGANHNSNNNSNISDNWMSKIDQTHVLSFVLGLWLAVTVWQASSKLFRKRRRRNMKPSSAGVGAVPRGTIMTQEQYEARLEQQRQEYDSMISALREELHEKSVAENEKALLWRQEKNILRSRIEEQHRSQRSLLTTEGGGSSVAGTAATAAAPTADKSSHAIQEEILKKISGLEDKVKFLSNLSDDQQQGIQEKQDEIEKLQNILGEMSESMHLDQSSSKKKNRASHVKIVPDDVQSELEKQISLRFSNHDQGTETAEETTAAADDDDDDDDSVLSDEFSDMDSSAAPAPKSRLNGDNKIVLLTSSMPGNLQVSVHQSRIESIFRHGLHLSDTELEVLDGCDAALQSLRNDLFQISGLHAVYPQVFLVAEGDIQFVGDFDAVVEMHDTRVLPERIGLILSEEDKQRRSSSIAERSESSTLTAKHNAKHVASPTTRRKIAGEGSLISPASPE